MEGKQLAWEVLCLEINKLIDEPQLWCYQVIFVDNIDFGFFGGSTPDFARRNHCWQVLRTISGDIKPELAMCRVNNLVIVQLLQPNIIDIFKF